MTCNLVRFPSMYLQWEREIPEPSRTGTSRNREREWSLEGQESDTNNSPIVSDIKLKWKIDKSLSTQEKSLKEMYIFSLNCCKLALTLITCSVWRWWGILWISPFLVVERLRCTLSLQTGSPTLSAEHSFYWLFYP